MNNSARINPLREALMQLRKFWLFILVLNVIIILFFICVKLFASQVGLTVGFFTRDPAATLTAHPLVGAVSSLGVLFWCATVVLCFFTSAVLWKQLTIILRRFLILSGLLTLFLLLDDLFMFHDYLGPFYLKINPDYIFAGIAAMGVALFIFSYKSILESEFILLLLALFYLASSLLIDQLENPHAGNFDNHLMLEDGLKFAGIVTWFLYFARYCYFLIRMKVSEPE